MNSRYTDKNNNMTLDRFCEEEWGNFFPNKRFPTSIISFIEAFAEQAESTIYISDEYQNEFTEKGYIEYINLSEIASFTKELLRLKKVLCYIQQSFFPLDEEFDTDALIHDLNMARAYWLQIEKEMSISCEFLVKIPKVSSLAVPAYQLQIEHSAKILQDHYPSAN